VQDRPILGIGITIKYVEAPPEAYTQHDLEVKNEELLITNMAGTRLHLESAQIPLWRAPGSTAMACNAIAAQQCRRTFTEEITRGLLPIPEAFAGGLAVVAGHCGLPLVSHSHWPDNATTGDLAMVAGQFGVAAGARPMSVVATGTVQ
jgi:hypothetical protein